MKIDNSAHAPWPEDARACKKKQGIIYYCLYTFFISYKPTSLLTCRAIIYVFRHGGINIARSSDQHRPKYMYGTQTPVWRDENIPTSVKQITPLEVSCSCIYPFFPAWIEMWLKDDVPINLSCAWCTWVQSILEWKLNLREIIPRERFVQRQV